MLMAHQNQNYDFFNRNQASPFIQSQNQSLTNQNSPLGGSPTLNLPYPQPNNQMQFFGDHFPPNTCSVQPRFSGPSNQQGSGQSGQKTQITNF